MFRPGAVTHTSNPLLWVAKAGGTLEVKSLDQPVRHSETLSLQKKGEILNKILKKKKIGV